MDHAHKLLKEEGGAVNLFKNKKDLEKIMLAGPELAKICSEFEDSKSMNESLNHEQNNAFQNFFYKDVNLLVQQFNGTGNPFLSTCGQLFTLDTKTIMDLKVKSCLKNLKITGKDQMKDIIVERISNSLNKPICDTLRKISIICFKILKSE